MLIVLNLYIEYMEGVFVMVFDFGLCIVDFVEVVVIWLFEVLVFVVIVDCIVISYCDLVCLVDELVG